MHGHSGLTISAIPPGDRIEILTETDHWLIDVFGPKAIWLEKQGSNEGNTRIIPFGTKDAVGVTMTDWLTEHGTFVFFNVRKQENDEIGPITLLVWKKDYHLLEPPPPVETPTNA